MNTEIIAPNRRILLIDDNESIHQDFRKILNPRTPARAALAGAAAALFGDATLANAAEPEFEIDSAFQGQEGFERVQRACADQRPYAMAFVDIRMPPGWDGIETIRRIWSEYPDLQVVICTAYSDYSLDQIVGRLGRTDRMLILKKPFDAIEVLQFADSLTEKWRLSREASAKMAQLEILVEERTRELREGQQRLVEARKMELVGKLAGGVAHDFNSILTAIIGHADLIRQVTPPGELPFESAVEIGKSASCAAKLTHQLLAFSRKQMLNPERVDLNGTIREIEPALGRILREGTEVSIEASAENPCARVDAGQLRQVLISLAHNASDAMPHGGRLTLQTANVTLDATDPEVPPGDYIMIAITDTGNGIADEVKPHLFEPYFTTKAPGEGKGLALAVCHGILKQSGGHIAVFSHLGQGTSFKLYLPVCHESLAPSLSLPPSVLPSQRGTEVILLVEEDAALRAVAAAVLEDQGYLVRRAGSGGEAMSIARRLDRLDLLIADAAMEGMTGQELAEWLCSSRPEMKVLLASASADENRGQGGLDPDVGFLRKPYTPAALSREVRATLDDGAPFAESAVHRRLAAA
jgi:signal transduction histidine kinase